MRYTRSQLLGILAARHGQPEGQGENAWLEARVKVTPEFLEGLLGGVWESRDGKRTRLEAIDVDKDGLWYPVLVAEVPAP